MQIIASNSHIEKLTPIEIVLGIDENRMTTARRLYEFLELNPSNFSRWAKMNITENPFAEEGTDFLRFVFYDETPTGGKIEREDFKLSATFAKKLSMQGKTERAEQARDYFIVVEDKLKEFARPHNVQTLTITSRDIARMLYQPKQHAMVLVEIRDCIEELKEKGFNPLEFFRESQYLGGNNEYRPQFIVTERGCEYYSGRLLSEERQAFIAEFKDRFERMQNVLDGKPVRGAKVNPGTGNADIKFFSNGKTGLVVVSDKVYTIASDKMPFIEKVVPELVQSNIAQIEEVITCILAASGERWGYELVASYGYLEQAQTHQIGQIEGRGTNTPKRDKKSEIEPIDLDKVVTLTKEQARQRYNIGANNLRNLAERVGAIVHHGESGTRILYNRKKLDDYFNKYAD